MAKDKPVTEEEIEVATEVAKLMIELDDKQLQLDDLKNLVDLLDKEL